MSTETDFTVEWLDMRYPFDEAARNKMVESLCLDAIVSEKEKVSIVDIGSGTGANFIYLFPKIAMDQHWVLIELNPELGLRSLERINALATTAGFASDRKDNTLWIDRGEQKIRVDWMKASFLQLEQYIDLQSVDLLLASAVFDLLSAPMMRDFLRKLQYYKIPLLSTLNYKNTLFVHATKSDNFYCQSYNQHMLRKQEFGSSLGPESMSFILKILKEMNAQVVHGESTWRLLPTDTKMMKLLLGFMENAIPEILENENEKQAFLEWINDKYYLLEQGLLEMKVEHGDVFVTWDT